MNSTSLLPYDPYDQQLLASVCPADWQNPRPKSRYNLVVVGGGPAGLVAAAGAAGLGAQVALIERGLLGGDCLNFGCVPSKALLRTARAAADVRSAAEYGVHVPGEVIVDFPEAMRRLRRLRAQLGPNDSAARFRSLGIDVFRGTARFTGPDRLEVAGETLCFARACISTGTRPFIPTIPGLEAAGFWTNESVFQITQLPPSLLVIGGGPVGCELAQAFARCGSRVTLVTPTEQLLPRDDTVAAHRVREALLRDGVDVRLQTRVREVLADGTTHVLENSAGEATQVTSQARLIAAGRVPNVSELNLDAAQVDWDSDTGIRVDDFLRSTNRRIFAAGDVCSRFRFTHAADALARIVVQNALIYPSARASRLVIPWCTYTDPQVAHVGDGAVGSEGDGPRSSSITVELADVDRAVLDGETTGHLTVYLRTGSDRLVGATIVARHASDLLAPLTLAIRERIGLKRLAQLIHPYPTQTEAIKRAADQFNRTRLTPRVRRWLERWFRWRRGA